MRMANLISEPEKRERLHSLMKEFDTAMLVTRNTGGQLHARPLAIAERRDQGLLYFATAAESQKVREVELDDHVNVTMQDKRRFVSVTGTARLTDDRALIEQLWSETWKIWFPKGKDDPSLRILIVDANEASYWDAGGIEGLRYLFESAKAYVTGARPDSDGDQRHAAHVQL
jgi:general stress protein 26